MKIYRSVSDVISDRRTGATLSELVENILHSPYVLEQIETPFELIHGFSPDDYVDASTTAWWSLPVELQMKYANAYQCWYIEKSGYADTDDDFRLPDIHMDMVFVPPMKYLMGSPNSEVGRKNDESQKEVFVEKPFLMGRYEVSNAEFLSISKFGHLSPAYNQNPVVNVSWRDCLAFCEVTHTHLPTEMQWELACRAGTTTRYNFGNDTRRLQFYAWFDENSFGQIHPVGEHISNAWGLFDMHGNVKEWCANKFRGTSSYYAIRGGSYSSSANRCRSASRSLDDPDSFAPDRGFRVCVPVFI